MAGEQRTTVTIGDLIASGAIVAHKDGNYGSMYPRVEEFGSDGVPFLTAKSVRDGYVDIAGAPRLADARADELTFGFVEPDDVLLSHNATIGRVAVVPPYNGRLLVGTSLTYFRLNPQKLLPRYLAVYMAGSDFQHQLVAVMSHSTRNQVPVTEQRNLQLVVPPLAEQRAIAHILGTLDDKIELNRRMSETLETMARALFKSWFVDFDPVRAKAEGRDSGLSQPLADLFPDRLVGSELGEIPADWAVGPLLRQARLLSGGTPRTERREYWNGDVAWASAKDVSQCGEVFLVDTERSITREGLEESSTQLIPAFASVVVARGATTGRLVMLGRQMAMNQTCYALTTSIDAPFGLYSLLRHSITDLVHAAHGSVFDTITTATFDLSKVTLAPRPVLAAFERAVVPLFSRILGSIEESRSLGGLRDALLPKLISGELRVKDAERFVGRSA